MSKIKDPREKKRLAYEQDHYNRGGQHDKGWRKIKPRKKAKARREFRRDANELTRLAASEEAAPLSALRKQGGLKQQRVIDWGVTKLKEFVESRLARREASIGVKKKRRAQAARFTEKTGPQRG